jgi:molybdenum cofactor cytidylyltransferase
MPGIAGVVLAAGASARMGRTKQVLPLGDGTVIGVTVANAEASRLGRVVVVTGANADEVEAGFVPRRAGVVRNPQWEAGNMSSLLVGIGAAGDADAVVHLLGDMPGVGREIIDRFVALWVERRPWAAVARYADREGHPILLSADAVAALGTLHGPKALWRFLEEAPAGPVERVEFDFPIPIDVDTAEDYARLLEAWPPGR